MYVSCFFKEPGGEGRAAEQECGDDPVAQKGAAEENKGTIKGSGFCFLASRDDTPRVVTVSCLFADTINVHYYI